jgi:hypothetical protein
LNVTLVLWIDAKWSAGREKSFCKVSIHSPNLFKEHHSKLARYIDLEGHETAFVSVSDVMMVILIIKLIILG